MNKAISSIFFFLAAGMALALSSCEVPDSSWEAVYDGPSGFKDSAKKMTADKAGNTYVLGSVERPHPDGISSPVEDLVVIKYNSSGQKQWAQTYCPPPGSTGAVNPRRSTGHDIAVDGSGNVYVAGWGVDGTVSRNCSLIIKYNANGNLLWERLYSGSGSTCPIVFDSLGNVYITGQTSIETAPNAYINAICIISFDSNGNELWRALEYKNESYSNTNGYSMVIDSQDNIYVGGKTFRSAVLYKYNRSGVKQWNFSYQVAELGVYSITNMVLDKDENIIATGTAPRDLDDDVLTLKISKSGTLVWAQTYSRTRYDIATGIALDSNGNIYVSAQSESGTGQWTFDMLLLKYNSSTGAQIWEKRVNAGFQTEDVPVSIKIDSANKIFVAFQTNHYSLLIPKAIISKTSSTVLVYNSDGKEMVKKTLNNLFAADMVLDNNDDFCITGTKDGNIITSLYMQ